MKKLQLKLFIVLAISSTLLQSCSKSDSPSNPKQVVYKNQTGDANADALQAQIKDTKGIIDIYGNFNTDRDPKAMKTLTYQKANNDTINHYVLDPITSRIKSAFYSVNGIRSNIVMKLDYGTTPTDDINISFFNYNWQNYTSQLVYATIVKNTNGTASNLPYYAGKSGAFWNLAQTAGAFAIADIISAGLTSAGTTGITFLLTPALATALLPVIGVIVVGVAIAATLGVFTNAGAAELTPSDTPYPINTPINNPVPQVSVPTLNSDPTPSFQTSSCTNTNITFSATMNSSGTISLSGVIGGTAPYTYFIGSANQSNPVFANNYANGTYFLAVKDANGCLNTQSILLTRPAAIILNETTWDLTTIPSALNCPAYTKPVIFNANNTITWGCTNCNSTYWSLNGNQFTLIIGSTTATTTYSGLINSIGTQMNGTISTTEFGGCFGLQNSSSWHAEKY